MSMVTAVKNIKANEKLLRELDKGIDDIEAGRVLSVDETFDLVTKLRKEKRNARVKSQNVG